MDLNTINNYLKKQYSSKLVFSDNILELIDSLKCIYEFLIGSSFFSKGIKLPYVEVYVIEKDAINALFTTIKNNYYIFIYNGLISKQNAYLKKLKFEGFSEEEKLGIIEKLFRFEWFFTVLHEYGHILYDHQSEYKEDYIEEQKKEYEADIFALKVLYHWIKSITSEEKKLKNEITDLWCSIYLLFGNMGYSLSSVNNDRIILNYYDPDIVRKRDHPLELQRIAYAGRYLSDLLNDHSFVSESLQKLYKIKWKSSKNIEEFPDEYTLIISDSIKKISE